MKKIIIALVFVLLFGINNSFSAWYGNHTENYSSNSWTSSNYDDDSEECKTYSDYDGKKIHLSVDSEATYDKMKYYFNGTLIRTVSGRNKGPFIGVPSIGTHYICYSKDGSVSSGTDNASVARGCIGDGDTTGGSHSTLGEAAVANNNSSSTLIPETDSEFNVPSSGNMRCLYWDSSIPESLSVSYTSGWTNNSKTITVKAKDRGGSKLKKIVLQQSQNGGSWTTVRTWDNLNSQNTIVTRTWNRTAVNGSNFKYKIIAEDYAGNSNTVTNNSLIKFDTTPPNISDIGNSTPLSNSYFIANNSKNIEVTVSPIGGSPIKLIEYYVENWNTANSYGVKQTENDGTINKNFNFQNVDKGVNSRGYREYSFKITKICDEAGNCNSSINKIFNYNIYADDINYGNSSITGINNLTSGIKISDGTNNLVKLSLKDKYGNEVVPIKRLNNTTIRNVDVNINYNNSLYLNQYIQSGNGAVNIDNYGILNIGNNEDTPDSGIFQNQANGIYDLNFKVYTPTENIYDKVKGSFKINNIIASVSDITGNKTFSSNIDFRFRPLYKTEFIGEIEEYGFLEGVKQKNKIHISKNGTRNGTNKKVYLKFGGEEVNKLTLTASGNLSTQLVSENTLSTIFQNDTSFIGNNKDLNTLLIQSSVIENLSKHYLSTHISYNLDGKNITYNSDIIGKNNYYDTTYNSDNTTQVGVKILGKTYSEKQNDIINNQGGDINKLSGKIDKSILKMYIRKNSYNLVKNLSVDYYTSLNNKYKKLGDVVYYKVDGGKIKYSDIDSNYKNTSGKTILIIGGDLVINQNINVSGIAGIIVLKDINGKGGNILIDDDVLKIDSVLYTDKVILPYNEYFSKILTQDDGIGYFKNQLLINGSVFSNNTIGGARSNPPMCPFYITNSCDIKEAQKYDLNFTRRYFVYDHDNNSSTYKVPANGGNSAVLPADPNYGYPFIIKYNSLIQTSPPPLFSK